LGRKGFCDPLKRIARLRNFIREKDSDNHISSPPIFFNEIDGLQKNRGNKLVAQMKRAYHLIAVEPRCLAQQAAAASWTGVATERFPTVAFSIKAGRGSIHCSSKLISAISVGESAIQSEGK
jgi:hypothetical protein